MLRPKTAFGRVVASAFLASAVVVLANLSNALFAAAPYQICFTAANPCLSCGGINNSTFQCIPPIDYQWGACSGDQQTVCQQGSFTCQDTEEYNCASTPVDQGPCPVHSGNGMSACKYKN
ncbi:MAG: hypothetical protein ACP5XB_31315 [Isosphaeraceae bacterium]